MQWDSIRMCWEQGLHLGTIVLKNWVLRRLCLMKSHRSRILCHSGAQREPHRPSLRCLEPQWVHFGPDRRSRAFGSPEPEVCTSGSALEEEPPERRRNRDPKANHRRRLPRAGSRCKWPSVEERPPPSPARRTEPARKSRRSWMAGCRRSYYRNLAPSKSLRSRTRCRRRWVSGRPAAGPLRPGVPAATKCPCT